MNIELTDSEIELIKDALQGRKIENWNAQQAVIEKLARQQSFKPFTPQEAREVGEYIASMIPEKKPCSPFKELDEQYQELKSKSKQLLDECMTPERIEMRKTIEHITRPEHEKRLKSLTKKSHWSIRAALRIAIEANHILAEPYITQIARIIREEQHAGDWMEITDNLPFKNEWHLTSFKGCIPRVLFRDENGQWPASKEIPPTHYHTPKWSDLKAIQQ